MNIQRFFLTLCFALVFLQSSQAQKCDRNLEKNLIDKGVCSKTATETICRDVCTGDPVVGRKNCTLAKHCCMGANNKCILKQITVAPQVTSLEQVRREFAEISGRGLVLTSVPQGIPPGIASLACPSYPDKCPKIISGVADIQPPVNIPYCQRIPCIPLNNQALDLDFSACMRNPGCGYDFELSIYRSTAGQAIMPGVPVCHLAIRNQAFQKRAQEYIAKYPWAPFITKCILDEFANETFANAPGCYMNTVLERFGHKPKMAGWKEITKRECYFINGCWMSERCVYPVDESDVNVPALSVNSSAIPEILIPFGDPKCQDLEQNKGAEKFLDQYHDCLASGCEATVPKDQIRKALTDIAISYLPAHLQYHYYELILKGKVRPDNWKEIADEVIEDKHDLTENFFGAVFPLGSRLNLPQGSTVRIIPFAFNLTANHTRTKPNVSATEAPGITGRGFSFAARPRTFGGLGRPRNRGSMYPRLSASGGRPEQPSVGGRSFSIGRNRNPPNLDNARVNLASSGFAQSQSIHNFLALSNIPSFYAPFINPPCPYVPFTWLMFPPLRGSLKGCCEKPACYLSKFKQRDVRSGVASYLGNWEQWSECSKTCGGGEMKRKRVCIGDQCPHIPEQLGPCNPAPCSGWTQWSPWAACDKTCGKGKRHRVRFCEGPPGSCRGKSSGSKPCHKGYCKSYTQWGSWSECHCTKKTRKRERYCLTGCPTEVKTEPCQVTCNAPLCDYNTCYYIDRVPCRGNSPQCRNGVRQRPTNRRCFQCRFYGH